MVKFYGHHSATKQNQFWITVGFSQWLIKKKIRNLYELIAPIYPVSTMLVNVSFNELKQKQVAFFHSPANNEMNEEYVPIK